MEGKCRQNLIEQGVSFLKGTASTLDPLSRRIQFLENKGLSTTEIIESIKNADQAQTFLSNSVNYSWFSSSLISSAVVISVGCITYFVTSTFLDDPLEDLVQENADVIERTITDPMNSDKVNEELETEISTNTTSKLDDLINELTKVETALNKMTVALETYKNIENDEPAWVKSVTSKITSLIEDKSNSSDSKSVIETQIITQPVSRSLPSEPPGLPKDIKNSSISTSISMEKRIEEINIAVKSLGCDSSGIQVQQKISSSGCGALIMYLKNILDHPEIPRYRKIITSNQNFKTMLQPLHNHISLLQSVGFIQKTPGSFEWSWAGSGDTVPVEADRVQLLRHAISQLTAKMDSSKLGLIGSPDADASAGGYKLNEKLKEQPGSTSRPVVVPGFRELLHSSSGGAAAGTGISTSTESSSGSDDNTTSFAPSAMSSVLASLQYEELNPGCDGEYHFAS